MTSAEIEVFHNLPNALPIYEAARRFITQAIPDVKMKFDRTQVGFSTRYDFAWLWPPIRKMKGRPDVYVILSFLLDEQVESPRIVEAVNPRPHRWTHHVIVQSADELDEELMGWLKRAYAFSSRGK